MIDIHFPRLLWTYSPGHARVKETDRADRLSGKTTIANGLRHLKSEVFRSLRHYLRAQSQELRTVGRLEERGVERGSVRRSLLKGRETTTISQTNNGTVSAATLGKLLRWSGAHNNYGLFRVHIYFIALKRTEQRC